MNYLTRLALNHDPLDLCLLSWDYRQEPLAPGTPSFKKQQQQQKIVIEAAKELGPESSSLPTTYNGPS
jgi:hypothetical protein